MKNNNRILMIFLLLPFTATAQDSLSLKTTPALQPAESFTQNKITGNIEMNYLRHYVWRGILIGGNAVAQPELNLKWKKFSLGLISNINYKTSAQSKENYTKQTMYDEQDVEAGYSTSYKKFDFECKAIGYLFFNQIDVPNTAELYNKTAFNINDKLSVFTENVVDIVSFSGAYYNNTGVCYSTSFGKGFSAEATLYASSGNKKFNNAYFESEAGGFNFIGGSVEATKDFGPFYLCFFAEINNYTNKGIKQVTQLKETDNYSFAVGWNF